MFTAKDARNNWFLSKKKETEESLKDVISGIKEASKIGHSFYFCYNLDCYQIRFLRDHGYSVKNSPTIENKYKISW
jgi:hypothetical protein